MCFFLYCTARILFTVFTLNKVIFFVSYRYRFYNFRVDKSIEFVRKIVPFINYKTIVKLTYYSNI